MANLSGSSRADFEGANGKVCESRSRKSRLTVTVKLRVGRTAPSIRTTISQNRSLFRRVHLRFSAYGLLRELWRREPRISQIFTNIACRAAGNPAAAGEWPCEDANLFAPALGHSPAGCPPLTDSHTARAAASSSHSCLFVFIRGSLLQVPS